MENLTTTVRIPRETMTQLVYGYVPRRSWFALAFGLLGLVATFVPACAAVSDIDAAWEAAKARYAALSYDDAETCAELITLAKAGTDTSADPGRWRDFVPAACLMTE